MYSLKKTYQSIQAIVTKFSVAILLIGLCSSIAVAGSHDVTDSAANLPTDGTVFLVTGEEVDPPTFTFTNGTKTVTYIPMTHIGTPAFYKAVAEKIRKLKSSGATLFYEFVDFDILDEINKRKARAMVGILPTPHQYDELSGDGFIGQPNDDFLGLVNDKDVNVDVTPMELIEAYENEFGPIVVTGVDATSDLSEMATVILPQENVSKIILDARNQKISNAITQRDETSIILLFGAAHGPGVFADLQLADPNWRGTQ